jgi:hypothetical protein
MGLQGEVSCPCLWLARFRPCRQTAQGGSPRDQFRRQVGSCRGGRRLCFAAGTAMARAGAYRHLVGRPWRRRPSHTRRVDPDIDLGPGRRDDAERVVRTPVPGGHGGRCTVPCAGRGSMGRDRRLSRAHGGIYGAAPRVDPARMGRRATRRSRHRHGDLSVLSARDRAIRRPDPAAGVRSNDGGIGTASVPRRS